MQSMVVKLVPKFVRAPSTNDRIRMFGRFSYTVMPIPGNPENIVVTDKEWRKNLIKVPLPTELAVLPGADNAWMHSLVAPRFLELVDAWRGAGLLDDIKTWNGAYCARFIRGRPGVLSAHSHGSAFDINVAWNQLGQPPTALGQHGSVLRLVDAAERLGWAWGGRFSRPDGQHFELARL